MDVMVGIAAGEVCGRIWLLNCESLSSTIKELFGVYRKGEEKKTWKIICKNEERWENCIYSNICLLVKGVGGGV